MCAHLHVCMSVFQCVCRVCAVVNVSVLCVYIPTGSYDYFMQKKIFEQPESVINTMKGRVRYDEYKGTCYQCASAWLAMVPHIGVHVHVAHKILYEQISEKIGNFNFAQNAKFWHFSSYHHFKAVSACDFIFDLWAHQAFCFTIPLLKL